MPKPLHTTLILILVLSQVVDPVTASCYSFLSPARPPAQVESERCLFTHQALGRALDWTRHTLFQDPTHSYSVRRHLSQRRIWNPFSGPGGDSAIGQADKLLMRGKRCLSQDRPARALYHLTRARILYRRALSGLTEDSDLKPVASQHLTETQALIQETRQRIHGFHTTPFPRITREFATDFILAHALKLHPSAADEVHEWKVKRAMNTKARTSQTPHPSFKDLVQTVAGTSNLHVWRRAVGAAKEDTAALTGVLVAEAAARAAAEIAVEHLAAAQRFPREWAQSVAVIKRRHGDLKRWAAEVGISYMPFVSFLRETPRDSGFWEPVMKSARITEQFPHVAESYAKKEKLDSSVGTAVAQLRSLGWLWADISRAFYDSPDLAANDVKAKRMYAYFRGRIRLPVADMEKLIQVIHRLSVNRSPARIKTELNLELHELELTLIRTGSQRAGLEEALHAKTEIPRATIRLGLQRRKTDTKGMRGIISTKKRIQLLDAARTIQAQQQELFTTAHKRLFVAAMAGMEAIVRVAPILNSGVPLSQVLAALAGQPRAETAAAAYEEILVPPAVDSSDTPERMRLLESISQRQSQIAGMLPNELLQLSRELRQQRMKRDPLTVTEAIEGIALFSETAARTSGIGQPTREQWLAALAMLLDGPVAVEQQTGEGKTISIAAAAYVMSLEGLGVQVHTFNRYLARRDAKWMDKVFQKLGCSVGVLDADGADDYVQHRSAHGKDITYGDADDFITDYLKDELEISADRQRQRRSPPSAVFLDEADPRLLDEAEDPIILSSPSGQRLPVRYLMAIYELGGTLTHETDFVSGQAYVPARLTEKGIAKVHAAAAEKDWSVLEEDLIDHVQDALEARYFCERNVDYVVLGDKIHLINETTHRLKEGAVWEGQLNNFIAIKERQRGINIPMMSTPLAHNLITRQDYYAMRNGRLRAISGTLMEATEELWRIYHLRAVHIPRTNPPRRVDAPFRLFTAEIPKWKAVEAQVQASHGLGWPVLTISPSIGAAQNLTEALRPSIPEARRLSVFEEAEEGRILAAAGQPGAETNATLMAGRGTDIRGSLVVIGTSPPLNRRGERQVRGRAGRWTDPGESYLFGSLDDSLFKDNLSSEDLKQLHTIANENGEVPAEAAQEALDKAREVAEGIRRSLRQATRDRGSLLTAHRERFFQQIASHATTRAAMLELNALWLDYLSEIRVLRRRLDLRDYIAQTSKLYDNTLQRAESIVSEALAQERERVILTRRLAALLPRLTALNEQGWEHAEMAFATATETFPAPLTASAIRALLTNKLPDNAGMLDQLEASLPAMEAPGGLTAFRKKLKEAEVQEKHESNLIRLAEIRTSLRTLVHDYWTVAEIAKNTTTKHHPQALSWQMVKKVLDGALPSEFVLTQLEVALPVLANLKSPSAILKAHRMALELRASTARTGLQNYIRQGWTVEDILEFTAPSEGSIRFSGYHINIILAGRFPNDPVMLDLLDATLLRMEGHEPPSKVRERKEAAYQLKVSLVRSRLQALVEKGWTPPELGQSMSHSFTRRAMHKMINTILSDIPLKDPAVIDEMESGLAAVEGQDTPSHIRQTERHSQSQIASIVAAMLRTLVNRGWKPSEIAQACVTAQSPTPLSVHTLSWIARGNSPHEKALLPQLLERLPALENRMSPSEERSALAREQMRETPEDMGTRTSQTAARRVAATAKAQERAVRAEARRTEKANQMLEKAQRAEARQAEIAARAQKHAERDTADRATRLRLASRASTLRDELFKLHAKGWRPSEIAAFATIPGLHFAQMTAIVGHLLRGHVPGNLNALEALERAFPLLHQQQSPYLALMEAHQKSRLQSELNHKEALTLKEARKKQREERARTAAEVRQQLMARAARVRDSLKALVARGWSPSEIARAAVTDTFQIPIHRHFLFWILKGALPHDPSKINQLEAALPSLEGQAPPSQNQKITMELRAERRQAAKFAAEILRIRTAAVRTELEALRSRGWQPIEIGKAAVTKTYRKPVHSRSIVWILRGSIPLDPSVIDQLEITLPALKDRESPSRIEKQNKESGQSVLGLRKRTNALRASLNKLAKRGWTPGDIGVLAKSNAYPHALPHMTIYHILAGHLPSDPKTLDQLEAVMPRLKMLQSRESSLKAASEYVMMGKISNDPLTELFFRRQKSDTRRKTFLRRAS